MYTVHQPWDPLKVCIVGRSYAPEFYSFITNERARLVMQRIARETEEDYQKLVDLLESFGVEVLRPVLGTDYRDYLKPNGSIIEPPMTPCDWSVMIGNTFYHNWRTRLQFYRDLKADHWPDIASDEEFELLPNDIKQPVLDFIKQTSFLNSDYHRHIIQQVREQGNPIVERPWKGCETILNRAQVTRIGRDLYFGTEPNVGQTEYSVIAYLEELERRYTELFPDYRVHMINTGGHSDASFCPVKPGLIVSLKEVQNYAETFPGWEVVYLPGQSWDKIDSFLDLKIKNQGKWWVPGEELNDDFTDFVHEWLDNWMGYVEETVFDINMLVIDQHNVVCTSHNEKVFEAFKRHGVTPHIVNFRHRYFWDGGLHCITSDLHRESHLTDWFPERG